VTNVLRHTTAAIHTSSGRVRLARRTSLPEQIAEAIISAGAEGRLALGERLLETELARELGVSRVPVREALRLLESRGIVVAEPNRGMRLMSVTTRELRQILTARASLERLAAREMIECSATGGLAGLERALADMEAGANAGDPLRVADADVAFHRTICLASENAIVLRFWDTLAAKLRIIFGVATLHKDLHHLTSIHRRLLDKLARADLAVIEPAIDRHIFEESGLQSFAEQHLPARAAG
jgi:DNA-binding GntR family transcriptional regulator